MAKRPHELSKAGFLGLGLGYMTGQDDVSRPGLLCEHLKDGGQPGEGFLMLAMTGDMNVDVPAEMQADVQRLGLKLFLCFSCGAKINRLPQAKG